MNRSKSIRILLIGLLLSLPTWHWASADVSPGDVIDTTNWQKAEGLLPEPVLNWVKNGDFVLNIGELNFNPADFFPPAALKSMESNVGKYELDQDDGIIDVKTGKLPDFIEGMPFPRTDPNDSKASQKIIYNRYYNTYCQGNLRFPGRIVWIGRKGYERQVTVQYHQASMDGYPPAKELKSPDNIERYTIVRVMKPFDLAGTAMMLWRYRGSRPDMNFAYAPTIRRVRRLSPANRSDALLGSDTIVDDAGGFDGKIPSFEWKVIGQREALMAFPSSDPDRIVQNEMGEWVDIPEDRSRIVWGYEKDGWQGAPWCPTNAVYVKRPVWVVEITAKDPYYNYGVQYLWVDSETTWTGYKQIHDRSGKYWKTLMIIYDPMESADKKIRVMLNLHLVGIDDRTQHASTSNPPVPPSAPDVFFADVDIADFSLAGFQKFCK